MFIKKIIKLLLLTFFVCSFGYADYGYKSSKISIVLSGSDLIFVGKVNKVEVTASKYTSHIEVVEMLKGSTGDKNIILNSKMINGALAEDEAYPQENNTYIFFCRKGEEGFVFTTTPLGILSVIPYVEDSFNSKDDIKLLLSVYNKNKEVFSKAGKQDLFNLYPQLKSEYIKSCLLYDLEDIVDENDIEFFVTGLKSDDVQYNLLSIRKVGNLRIEQFKETIANLLFITPDTPKNNNKLFHLLAALRDFADIKYKDIFFNYLSNPSQSLRVLAIEAIGRYDEETWLALVPYYALEPNWSNRGTMLWVFEKIQNNDILLPIIYQLREIETHAYTITRIDDIIARRTGR